jgi:Multicopper oxidase
MALLPFIAAVPAYLAFIIPSIYATPVYETSSTIASLASSPTAFIGSNVPNKPKPSTSTMVTGSVIGTQTLTPGETVPSGYYNPNGPYFNPNDYTSLPFTWPGKPSGPKQSPPPRPSIAPFPSGGPSGSQFQKPAWVPNGMTHMPSGLPQSITNGNSPWGLIDCALLFSSGIGQTCGNMPPIGITRYYDFTISYQKIAPDGVVKNGITINGGFPGPIIEANWGDTCEILSSYRLSGD